MAKKKLCRSLKNKMIFGVCGGIAEYFNFDVTVVRIITVLLALFGVGTGIVVYLIIALIMPSGEKYSNEDVTDDDLKNMKSANFNPEEKKSSGRSDSDFNSHFN